jgi:hypothetical protein
MRSLTQDLQSMYQSLSAVQAGGGATADVGSGAAAGGTSGATGGSSDDDVIDAEFTSG